MPADISTIRSHASLALTAYKLSSGGNNFLSELADAKKTSDETFAVFLQHGLETLPVKEATTRHFLTILDHEIKVLNNKEKPEDALAAINKLDEAFRKRFPDDSWTSWTVGFVSGTDAKRFNKDFQTAYTTFISGVREYIPKSAPKPPVVETAAAPLMPAPTIAPAPIPASATTASAGGSSAKVLRVMPLVADAKAPPAVKEFSEALKEQVKKKLIEYAADDYEFAELNKQMSALIKADTVFINKKNLHYTWIDDVFAPNLCAAQFGRSLNRKEYVTTSLAINEWRAVMQRHYGVVASQTLNYSSGNNPSEAKREARDLINKFFDKAIEQRKRIDLDAQSVFPKDSAFYEYACQLKEEEWREISWQGIAKSRERDAVRLQSVASPGVSVRRMAHA